MPARLGGVGLLSTDGDTDRAAVTVWRPDGAAVSRAVQLQKLLDSPLLDLRGQRVRSGLRVTETLAMCREQRAFYGAVEKFIRLTPILFTFALSIDSRRRIEEGWKHMFSVP